DHLDGCVATRIVEPRIGKVHTEHPDQHVEQRPDNLPRLLTTPQRGKGQDTDQIVDTAPQPPDLVGCPFHLTVLASARVGYRLGWATCPRTNGLGGRSHVIAGVMPGMALVTRYCVPGFDEEAPAAARRMGSPIVSRRRWPRGVCAEHRPRWRR